MKSVSKLNNVPSSENLHKNRQFLQPGIHDNQIEENLSTQQGSTEQASRSHLSDSPKSVPETKTPTRFQNASQKMPTSKKLVRIERRSPPPRLPNRLEARSEQADNSTPPLSQIDRLDTSHIEIIQTNTERDTIANQETSQIDLQSVLQGVEQQSPSRFDPVPPQERVGKTPSGLRLSSKESFEKQETSLIEVIKKGSTAAIKKLEMLTTNRMPAIQGVARLDKFETVPSPTVQGLKNGHKKIGNTRLRLAGLLFIGIACFYIPWLYSTLNRQALWFSIPFFASMCYLTLLLFITIYNNWLRSAPELIRLPHGQEKMVAVCVPTYGETPEMVQTTIESVLSQDWPHDKLLIVLGDDSHRAAMREMVETLQYNFPAAQLVYHEPPKKGNPARKGSAKDGNLNSMLAYVREYHPDIEYIETRDADDVIGSPQFLRYAVGHLERNQEVAYVQTIKDTLVSQGDPFGNRQTFFYRGVMLARNATNSVFPCGSGLVWRIEKLMVIDGFPTWNLVEDLYSGYVAMRHGLKTSYLPVVGAIGQVSPEDIPNVYKQLGTWAMDAMRIFLWKNPWLVKGLTFNQRMQFTELGLFYLLCYPLLILLVTPIIILFTGIHPFNAPNLDGIIHFWTYAVCIEVLLSLTSDSSSFEDLWRARQMWLGLVFVFIKSTFLALVYGPNKKPAYKVTRKTQQAGIYIREIIPQALIFLLLLVAAIYHLYAHRQNMLRTSDLGSVFWAAIYLLLLAGMIHRSWFGFHVLPAHQNKAKA